MSMCRIQPDADQERPPSLALVLDPLGDVFPVGELVDSKRASSDCHESSRVALRKHKRIGGDELVRNNKKEEMIDSGQWYQQRRRKCSCAKQRLESESSEFIKRAVR